jgi:hypothetical protein
VELPFRIKFSLSRKLKGYEFPAISKWHNVVSNMKKILPIIFILIICSCAKQNYKTIDFGKFKITVPEKWNKYERSGMDSYIGGIITDKNDTLNFDYGLYSNDISKDFPMVYDKESFAELSKRERELLPKTKHLIVEDLLYWGAELKNYLKYNVEFGTIDCFKTKIITPRNKGYGGTGIYIDSLKGSRESFDKVSLGFYGWYLSDETQAKVIKAFKTLKFEDSCE